MQDFRIDSISRLCVFFVGVCGFQSCSNVRCRRSRSGQQFGDRAGLRRGCGSAGRCDREIPGRCRCPESRRPWPARRRASRDASSDTWPGVGGADRPVRPSCRRRRTAPKRPPANGRDRPAALIFGVRPNSPETSTITRRSSPRSYRSVTKAAKARSTSGSDLFLSVAKLSRACPILRRRAR